MSFLSVRAGKFDLLDVAYLVSSISLMALIDYFRLAVLSKIFDPRALSK